MDEEKILIIEVEPKIADTLKLGLSEQDYQADVAYDGVMGQQLFNENKYDLVVLDINLPGINGYNLCKNFRLVNPHIPIIMLTSLIELNDKVEGYEAGADDYIVKPFEFKELLLKIRVFLKRTLNQHSLEAVVLRAGD